VIRKAAGETAAFLLGKLRDFVAGKKVLPASPLTL
jgi:hypothetical protein